MKKQITILTLSFGLWGITSQEVQMPFINRYETVYIDDGKILMRVDANHRSEFVVEEGTEIIGAYSFFACTGLTSVVIPDTVTHIMNDAFYNCWSLTNVVFGNNLCIIGKRAFNGCSKLQNVNLPNSVENINDMAFSGCPLKNGIKFGNNIKQIGWYSLGTGLSSYTELEFNEGLESLGNFSINSSQIGIITLPSTLTNITPPLVSRCNNLTNILISVDNPRYLSVDGVLYDRIRNSLVLFPMGRDDTHFTVPDWVSTIDAYAFYGSKISNVILHSNVKFTNDFAFSNINKNNNAEYQYAISVSIHPDNQWLRVENKRVVQIQKHEETKANNQ